MRMGKVNILIYFIDASKSESPIPLKFLKIQSFSPLTRTTVNKV
jgi:hypothetical protein